MNFNIFDFSKNFFKGGYLTITHDKYMVNKKGEKIAIILPIEEYEQIKEDLHDLDVIAERRNEKTISFYELKRNL